MEREKKPYSAHGKKNNNNNLREYSYVTQGLTKKNSFNLLVKYRYFIDTNAEVVSSINWIFLIGLCISPDKEDYQHLKYILINGWVTKSKKICVWCDNLTTSEKKHLWMIGQENIENTKYGNEHEGFCEILNSHYILEGYWKEQRRAQLKEVVI